VITTTYRVRYLLDRARALAVKLPRESQDDVLQRIHHFDEVLHAADNPHGMMHEMFEMAFGEDDLDDELL
jgi:hypothetical protein